MRRIVLTVAALAALAVPVPALAQGGALEPVPGQPVPGNPTPTPADPTVTVPPADEPVAPAPAPSEPKQSGQDKGLAWLTVGLIALAVILAAILVVLLLWRVRGWDPNWLKRWRHATSEAGWRVSLGTAELRDFVRLGR